MSIGFGLIFFLIPNLTKILHKHKFINVSFHEDVFSKDDSWNCENITFCKALKE